MHAAGMDGTAGDWTGQEWKGQAWTTSVVLGTPQCYRGELQIVQVFANRKKTVTPDCNEEMRDTHNLLGAFALGLGMFSSFACILSYPYTSISIYI